MVGNKKIYGVYFIALLNNWELVVIEQLDKIFKSELFRPDAGLYHLPFTKILNEEKLILGLSNLHFRFGHTSILQYGWTTLSNLGMI